MCRPLGSNTAGTQLNSTDENESTVTGRKAAISFILLTLFIDILGIGIIIPVLPELIKGFIENDPEIVAGKSAEEFWEPFRIATDVGRLFLVRCLFWASTFW